MAPKEEKTVEERVIEIISDRTGVEAKRIKRKDKLVDDLGARLDDLALIRKDVAKKFDIKIPDDDPNKFPIAVAGVIPAVPADDFKRISTVGEMIDYVEKALKKKAPPECARAQPMIIAGLMRGPNN